MRAVIQRVSEACVDVEDHTVGRIGHGLLVFLGVETSDSQADLEYICTKVAGLRIFEDEQGKLNRCVGEAGGAVLVVSQFTLLGDARNGRRPSFTGAAAPEEAEQWYLGALIALQKTGLPVQAGQFGAEMKVHLVNDGPVTILLDSKRVF